MAEPIIGARVPRANGLANLTGATRFVDDVVLPGTLWVKVARSPVHKGVVRHLDLSAAERAPGVVATLTANDVPNNHYGMGGELVVLNNEALRYRGEPMVAVAAESEDAAQEAADRIRMDIEEQEPVFDPFQAMQPGAPRVSPRGNFLLWGDQPCRRVALGDVEAGFRAADLIVEGEYRQPAVKHAQLEPHVSLAVPDAGGALTIYTCNQSPYLALGSLASILRMPASRLHLVAGTVGGGFGGKNDIYGDHIVALLAMKTGRPVKYRWTRAEDLIYSTHRGMYHMYVRDGVTGDGRIVARYLRTIHDCGAYGGTNQGVLEKHSAMGAGPYYIPNVLIEAYGILTNHPRAGAMRGFGVTASNFAIEVQMDRIAGQLGLDPWEIRLKNALRRGDQMPGCVLEQVAAIEVMQAVAARAGITLPTHLQAMSSTQGRDSDEGAR